MFTGIVAALGKVERCQQKEGDLRVTLDVSGLDMADVSKGDSIAVNGTCLTAVEFDDRSFTADVSAETVALTSPKQWQVGARVNLEKALTPTTRLGGHLVMGHVDGKGRVAQIAPVGQSLLIEIEAPAHLARYIAKKGSVTLDGISLTVNRVDGRSFYLNIVPHTAEITNIKEWRVGGEVNLEVDVIARYLERLVMGDRAADPQASSELGESGGITAAFLAEHGFGPK